MVRSLDFRSFALVSRATLASGLRILAALLALQMVGGLAASQPLMEPGRPYFRAHLVRHGLPQSTVMSIATDSRGVLWVGTQDGAGWYDGTRWTTVDMPERQISNYVECVLPASDGSVWFGRSDGGIARLNPDGSWARYGAEQLPALRVTALAEVPGPDGRLRIWAGTYGGGLTCFQDGKWSLPQGRRGFPHARIWKLVPSQEPDRKGHLWVCGEGGTLALLSPSGAVQTFPGLPQTSINHLLESRDDQGRPELWVSTFGAGIGTFKDGKWTFLTSRQGLPSNFMTDVAETRTSAGKRVQWFASVGGLSRLEDGRLRTFTARSGLGTDAIYRLRQDQQRADSLWIGTLGGGLLQFREGGWLTHDTFSGLPGNFVLSIAQGRSIGGKPTILAGTSTGLSRFVDGQWQAIALPPGVASTRINALLESRRGDRPALWAGTLSGLLRLEGGRWTTFGEREGLPSPAIGSLLEGHDPQGREVLWVGTQNGGLAAFDGTRWTVQDQRTGLPSDNILALAEHLGPDRKRSLWAGFRNGGLGRCTDGRWVFWDRSKGLPNNSVASIHFSRSAAGRPRIFAGTLGGGLVWAWLDTPDLQWNLVSSLGKDALPNDSIQGILEDSRGRLYLSTNRGVCRLTPRGESAFDLYTFVERDGLPGLQCSPGGNLIDQEGRLWVATTLGLAELPISADPPLPAQGRLILREARAGGEPIHPPPGSPVVLRPPVRDVDLEFCLLDYQLGTKIQYRTQLMGLEEHPSAWETTGRRSFTNLAPGRYSLRIWAQDDLERQPAPLDWPFEILPAAWETFWFRGFLVLVAAALLFLYIRWRLQSIHSRAEELERLVSERTEDLARTNLQLVQEIQERTTAEKVKDEFVSVVSHELRTPLTSIRGALGLVAGGVVGNLPAQASELIRIAHTNALRLMALVNDLLDIQKLEADQIQLSLERVDLRALVVRMIEAHQGLAQSFGSLFRFQGFPTGLIVRADARRIEQVMGNLLANAAKFSHRGSEVEVSLEARAPFARISVTNHGAPIPVEFRSRIFTKFAQADASSTRPAGGTGLGLAISKVLVEAHGGRIGFNSDERATTFWFELALAEEVESPSQASPGSDAGAPAV